MDYFKRLIGLVKNQKLEDAQKNQEKEEMKSIFCIFHFATKKEYVHSEGLGSSCGVKWIRNNDGSKRSIFVGDFEMHLCSPKQKGNGKTFGIIVSNAGPINATMIAETIKTKWEDGLFPNLKYYVQSGHCKGMNYKLKENQGAQQTELGDILIFRGALIPNERGGRYGGAIISERLYQNLYNFFIDQQTNEKRKELFKQWENEKNEAAENLETEFKEKAKNVTDKDPRFVTDFSVKEVIKSADDDELEKIDGVRTDCIEMEAGFFYNTWNQSGMNFFCIKGVGDLGIDKNGLHDTIAFFSIKRSFYYLSQFILKESKGNLKKRKREIHAINSTNDNQLSKKRKIAVQN